MFEILLVIISCLCCARSQERPNIVFIVADDLGWNDVGFHGSNQIPTPNIDALAYSGVILNRYYVAPVCTPSRSALMTGKYPIHTGMQHDVLNAGERRGLPLTEKLLPQYLKELGYSTHAVGKWHLGFYKREYTPLYRGFDSHFGYWTGHQDYYDHSAMEMNTWGLDMRRGMEPNWADHGAYSTDLFTSEAVSIISKHNKSTPLFLYLAHVAVHSANPYNPLPAPDYLVAQFDNNITDYSRRRFAAMLTKLDDSVGKVVHSLKANDMLTNTIIVFTTDNGGPAAGFNLNYASNWPLRGVKYTLWEGGVRGAGFLWSSQVQPSVSNEKVHITDWLPTLLRAAGYKRPLTELDGVDAWDSITKGLPSLRERILHNIDIIDEASALTVGDWKIIKGIAYESWDRWYGPSGRDVDLKYDTKLIMRSPAGQALREIGKPVYSKTIWDMRHKAEVSCGEPVKRGICEPKKAPCLFNIKADPCEKDNLAQIFPSILINLERELEIYNATALPPANLPADPGSNPKYWGNTWTNFGDFPSPTPPVTTTPTTTTTTKKATVRPVIIRLIPRDTTTTTPETTPETTSTDESTTQTTEAPEALQI